MEYFSNIFRSGKSIQKVIMSFLIKSVTAYTRNANCVNAAATNIPTAPYLKTLINNIVIIAVEKNTERLVTVSFFPFPEARNTVLYKMLIDEHPNSNKAIIT